jgi:hypothetical protein
MYLGVGMDSSHGLYSLLQRRVSLGLEAERAVVSTPYRSRFGREGKGA